MHKKCIYNGIVLVIVFLISQPAEASREVMQRIEDYIRIEEFDTALELLRELQVESPDNEMVLQGIAVAHQGKAQKFFSLDDIEQGLAALGEARSVYQRLAELSSNPETRLKARFNAATLTAQESKVLITPEDYNESVARIRRAVDALNTVVTQYPEHEAARHNLEHMRLVLKDLLANPPEQEGQEDKSPPDEQPQLMSIFNFADTELPGADAELAGSGDTVILHPSGRAGAVEK